MRAPRSALLSRLRLAALLALAAALLAACAGNSVEQPSGSTALMRVNNARFVMSAFPASLEDPDAGAPEPDLDAGVDAGQPPARVHEITSQNNLVRAGQRNKGLGGRVSFTARSVALGLEGDQGYWVVPVGSESVENPPDLEFAATVDFSADLPAGTRHVLVAAADAAGQWGPARSIELTVAPPVPDGDLVVSLEWDRDADLDLLILQPDGNILAFGGVRTPGGMLVRSTNGPRVDINSNANCAIDGVRRENAVFSTAPTGTYEVRVRMFRSCGVPLTNWRVRIYRSGAAIADAVGTSYGNEPDMPGGGPDGLGRRALAFTLAE